MNKAEVEYAFQLGIWKTWLNENVKPPYREMIDEVWKVLEPKNVPIPTMGVSGAKEIPYLYWSDNKQYASIEFYPDHEVKLFLLSKNRLNNNVWGDEADNLPDFFIDLISNIKTSKEEDDYE